MTQPAVALVVAAGSGSRLGAEVPKAFVEIEGRTLIEHSCRALAAGGCNGVVVVAPASHLGDAAAIVNGLGFPGVVVPGGARRQDSVAAGLDAVTTHFPSAEVVLVHDAARPFVPASQVSAVIDAVRGGAVAVVPIIAVTDSIRKVNGDTSVVVDRSDLVAVQTPQGFRLSELLAAHQAAAEADLEVTDDAAVCEAAGHHIELVPGSREAMKVTDAFDLVVAAALVAQRDA